MEWLIWIGAAISLAGLLGLGFCILRIWRAKRAGMEDEALRALLARTVPINMISLFGSVIGLMCVIVGISLG